MTATPPGRGPGDGAPEEGTPEYEWLYGSGGQPPADDDSAPTPSGRHRSPTASESSVFRRAGALPTDATRAVPRQERPDPGSTTPPADRTADQPADQTAVRPVVPPVAPPTTPPAAPPTPPPAAPAAPRVQQRPPDPRPIQRPGRGEEPPEDTRVMSILPPSQSQTHISARQRRAQLRSEAEDRELRGATRPTPPPLAPTPGSGRRGFRPRFRFRYVFLLLLLWLVFLVVVPLMAWNKVSKIDAMPSGDRPADQPGRTYLLVGTDSRADLTPAERKELNTGGDVGSRTDTIMLLHTGSGPNLLMSIPRDSLVPIPGHGTTKINAAYAYGGPKLLIRTIELNTGIRVDDYVEIGFGGFVGLVDAVGGIQICPKEDMVDADANLKIKKGCQDVDGEVALAYARSRHAQQLGDLDRAAHQREVVAAVGKKAVSPMSLVNPLRYWNLNMAGADFVAIDDQMGPVTAAQFAMAMTKVNGSDGLTCGVPISDLAVHWDDARSKEMFQLIQQDDTAGVGKDLCTPSGLSR